jgi:hypothetical protein
MLEYHIYHIKLRRVFSDEISKIDEEKCNRPHGVNLGKKYYHHHACSISFKGIITRSDDGEGCTLLMASDDTLFQSPVSWVLNVNSFKIYQEN